MLEKLGFIPESLLFTLCRIESEELTDIYFTVYEPLTVRVGQRLLFVGKGGLEEKPADAVRITPDEVEYMLFHACGCAVYAHEEELKNGFVSLRKGNRIGVCGSPVIKDGRVCSVRNVTSLCVRLAHEKKHFSDCIMPFCVKDGYPVTALVFGPPGYGKTTLLRDMIRSLSCGGFLVSCVDCRNEIAGTVNGKRTFDLGPCCVCSAEYDKCTGIEMAVRTQRPDIVAFDEIGKEESTVRWGRELGVSFLFTAHADCFETLRGRREIGAMIEDGIIETVIQLEKGYRPRVIRYGGAER